MGRFFGKSPTQVGLRARAQNPRKIYITYGFFKEKTVRNSENNVTDFSSGFIVIESWRDLPSLILPRKTDQKKTKKKTQTCLWKLTAGGKQKTSTR